MRALVLAIVLLSIPAAVSRAMTPDPTAERLAVWIAWSAAEEEDLSAAARMPIALAPRALERLARAGVETGATELTNRPVPERFVQHLRGLGIEVRHASRALRAVSADLTPAQYRKLLLDPRVGAIDGRPSYLRTGGEQVSGEEGGTRAPLGADPRPTRALPDPRTLTPAQYGNSWSQNEQIGVNRLHERGYAGDGVLVCLLDAGSNNLHPSLLQSDLVAMRDFVGGDDNVRYTPGDPDDEAGSDSHGTYTWTTLGGFASGNLVGPAYRASFVVGRTEYTASETRVEEDDYVAGIEWADSLGADVVSTSLGYLSFDNGFVYSPQDLDGRTAVTTRAAAWAVRRGIVVVTAAGNEGPGDRTIITPADAESVVAVGAVSFLGNIASFSSRGPTAHGRIKPDICARGVSTYCGTRTGGYAGVNGTSLSTPLIGGLAALLRQAHPEWSAFEIGERLRSAADRASAPDNTYGHGIPDGFRAAELPGGSLVVDATAWQDSVPTGGAGDTLASPGERGSLRVRVRNAGREATAPTRLSPSSLSPQVRVLSGSYQVPSLAPGASLWMPADVALALSDSASAPAAAPLFLSVLGEDGTTGARRAPLLLVPRQWFTLNEFSILEECGRLTGRVRFADPIGLTAIRFERRASNGAPLEPVTDWVALSPQRTDYTVTFPAAAVEAAEYFLRVEILSGLYEELAGPAEFLSDSGAGFRFCALSPNPLVGSGVVDLMLQLPRPTPVTVELYDPAGRRVDTPIRDQRLSGGQVLPITPASRLASGLYFVKVSTDFGSASRRLVLIR
ncbi:MAG: S8 family serine peptidase [Candidatus Eisenbacteria bacterium]|nr:S8 family serine peptidase [Candidatus Eisenbacteria bacterium]